MSYKLDIQDDLMSIQGLYGTYEASNNEKGGFMISVVLGSYVYELDAEGEDYIVENGQEWAVPAKNLTELNEFIRMCEDEKLWPGVQDEARYRKRHYVHQRTDKELCDWRARKEIIR